MEKRDKEQRERILIFVTPGLLGSGTSIEAFRTCASLFTLAFSATSVLHFCVPDAGVLILLE